MMLAAVFFVCFTSAVTCSPLQKAGDSTVTVKTEDGLLRGKIATSIWNKTYHSFQAIPFAQPPVGDLRFKTPQPVKPWTGVRDAVEQGPYCPQQIMNYTTAKMSEDCLYLNVYVPQVASSAAAAKGLSVMVWIHNGGFIMGSGIYDLFGPDNLMNRTAILVTLNHRLGALGFLSMEHPSVTSNAGMKDMVAALRWVKRNIAHFGGNPDDVTVFGDSSGGVSVELMLLSPMTEGLFQRAISESGSPLNMEFTRDYNGTAAAFRLGEVLGYNATDADDLLKFLRSANAEDIVKAQSVAGSATGGSTVKLRNTPTLEAKTQDGIEVFLPDAPETLLKAGKIHPIPYITGANSEEMKLTEIGITQAKLDNYSNNMEQFIPSDLNVKKGTTESLELAEKIKKFYFGNKTVGFDTLQELVNLFSDGQIYPVHRVTMYHVKYGSAPVYNYLFTYDGTLRIEQGNFTVKGPGHEDDTAYLFYISYIPYSPNSDDIKVIRHFINLWVDFAEHGEASVNESVKWTPVTKTNHTYLQIDVELSLHQDMLKDRMAFWDNVYETYKK